MKVDQDLITGLVKSHISSMLQSMSLATAYLGEPLYQSIRDDAAMSGEPADREIAERLIALLKVLAAQFESAVRSSQSSVLSPTNHQLTTNNRANSDERSELKTAPTTAD